VNRAALRSTVDSRQWRPERLAGAAEPGSSPRVGEKGEELYGGGGPHRGLRWPVQRRGKAGDSEGRTMAVKLSVGRVEA
jgi:hypothetical protein